MGFRKLPLAFTEQGVSMLAGVLKSEIAVQVSKYLNCYIGEGISWSPRNLWFMRQLVNEYSNLNQAGSEIEEYVKQLVSEVPWKHNILILQKVKNLKAQIF